MDRSLFCASWLSPLLLKVVWFNETAPPKRDVIVQRQQDRFCYKMPPIRRKVKSDVGDLRADGHERGRGFRREAGASLSHRRPLRDKPTNNHVRQRPSPNVCRIMFDYDDGSNTEWKNR